MLTWTDIWSYIRTLLRWWPILVIATALAGGTAWFLSRSQPDYYQARATIMVGNNFEVTTPNPLAVDLSNALAKFYEVLLRREIILGPVAEQLQLPFPWQVINEMLYTEVNPRANLLEIAITDTNPDRAAALANAIAERLINYSPTSSEKVATQQAEVDRQLVETQATINELERRIRELRERQVGLSAAVDLRENQQQLTELEAVLERNQTNYNRLLSLRNDSSANTLSIFEAATPPQYPIPQKRMLIVGAAAAGGLMLAVIAVFLIDWLDPRWRNGRDLQQRIGIANLGAVVYRWPFHVTINAPEAHRRERAVRDTHTRIALEANDRLLRLLLVSSPEPNESRSAYVIDLANTYAQAGHRVLLVDAELNRPYVSRLLSEWQVANHPSAQHSQAIERWAGTSFRSYNISAELQLHLRPTPMTNVALLPSRDRLDQELSVLVPSLHWPDLVNSLRDAADVVIFDGPSTMTGADAALLAPLVDGVVLVLNPRRDTLAQITESKNRLLRNGNTRLLGAVTISDDKPQQVAIEPAKHGREKPGRLQISGVSLALDTQGITITLPSRGKITGRPALSSGPEPIPHVDVRSDDYEHEVDEIIDQPPDDRFEAQVVDYRIFGRQSTSTLVASSTETVIVTPPPPAVIVTPPPSAVIVTPPPDSHTADESGLHERAVGDVDQQIRPAARRRPRVAGQSRRGRHTRTGRDED